MGRNAYSGYCPYSWQTIRVHESELTVAALVLPRGWGLGLGMAHEDTHHLTVHPFAVTHQQVTAKLASNALHDGSPPGAG